MYVLIFICSVVWICLGLFVLTRPNHVLNDLQFKLLAIIMIVHGCTGAGVALVHLNDKGRSAHATEIKF